ncbi:hypothetical protein [Blautia sp. MCC283]|uniref:hypothetical protein n=1 Tax=Blautia sp. MCC283 TaxID=2592640 RepID=UPI001C0194DC|nr:hypothetical protein [Blautia sp. MCC283]MBT9839874.1 hypothetical protein [Blautia sp. MCC283]
MGFDPNMKGRSFIAVIHVKNLENMGLTEEQIFDHEFVAEFVTEKWDESARENMRTCAVAVCMSEQGTYHLHMALYTKNPTTLRNVSSILGNSHVEPQLGGKKALADYMTKTGKYEEKGEKVFYTIGIDNVEDVQGKRSDLEMIDELLDRGWTPQQIFDQNIKFYRFEKIVRSAFADRKIKSMPRRRPVYTEYHFGDSRSGKTFCYNELCDKIGEDEIYLFTDFDNQSSGGMDKYLDAGAPRAVFMDEFKGKGVSYQKLLVMMNEYPKMQTHARFENTYNLWDIFVITTIFAPEELYLIMVGETERRVDTYEQLRRRLKKIVYHFKNDNGEYMTYTMKGNEYVDREDIIARIKGNIDPDRFRKIETQPELTHPFEIQ